MQIVTDLTSFAPFCGGVVSIGNFDGVHRGHQQILKRLVSRAREKNVPAVAMTFDPPPVALIAPQRVPPRLSTVARKAELMSWLDVDCLLVYPTTREFLSLTAQQFFEQVIGSQLQSCGLVEGPNFFFGKNRSGNIDLLASMTATAGLDFEVVPAQLDEGETISSSGIRQMIAGGQFDRAVSWLGHPYRLTGIVSPGAARGTGIGFPTANLNEILTLVPHPGVYAATTTIEGKSYPAAVHIGGNPTFAEESTKVEVHVIGFQGDLYGRELSIDLTCHLRQVQRFSSVEALQEQLQKDIAAVMASLP
ncbi:MAG: riboflavin biosynthesis protein RibF [Planctomycetaceae bacterium]|nr:riboflavin biosynthesis protein RibF [Planctomycetaceae bacterium]